MKLLVSLIGPLALASVATAQEITIARAGSQPPQPGPAENFTGTVRVERLFAAAEPGRTSGGLVTFEAGARSAWHTHPLGQILIVTAGTGRVQHWGGPIQEIRKGDTVRIPPNVKHWHGASPKASMSHIAITEQLEGKLSIGGRKSATPSSTHRCRASHRQPHRRLPAGPNNWSATLLPSWLS